VIEPPEGETLTFEPGDLLIARGSTPGDAFLLLTGSARIELEPMTPALVVGPGSLVGEADLRLDQPQSANVIALERVAARRLTRAQLAAGSTASAPASNLANEPPGNPLAPLQITITGESDALARQIGMRILSRLDLPFAVGRRPGRTERPPRTPLSLVLADDRPFNLSRRHFAIDMSPAGPVVHDPGSQLGTLVNGIRIGTGQTSTLARLYPGDNRIVAGANASPFRFIVSIG